MTRRNIKTAISLLAVIAVAVMVFCFSAQDGQHSSKLSGAISQWVLNRLIPGFAEMTAAQRAPYLERWGFYIRKAAHFSEFALLAATLLNYLHYVLLNRRLGFMAMMAWALATLYACTDEFHQMFVASRGPSLRDVCIDSAGALAGALFGLVILIWRMACKRHAAGQAD